MYLKFLSIKAKNFLSFGNDWTEIDFTSDKLTLVVGNNGAGKSALILDALIFALYGKPYRPINKSQLINTINQKQMMVIVEFEAGGHHYTIRRGMKPSLFEIYQNGKLLDQDAARGDYQHQLESSILKINYKTFCQVIVLGKTSYVPFMELTASDRRKVIEDLLDLEIFTKMNSLMKDQITEVENAIRKVSYNKKLTNEKLDVHKTNVDNLRASAEKSKQAILDKKEISVADLENQQQQIAAISGQISQLTSLVSKLSPATSTVQKLQQLKSQLNSKISRAIKEIEFYQHNASCPTCDQPISDQFKAGKVQRQDERISEVRSALLKLDEKLASATEKTAKISQLQNEINQLQINQNIHQSNVRNLNNQINDLDKQLQEVDHGALTSSLQAIADLSAELAQLSDKHNHLNQDREVLNYASLVLRDDGIKAQIVKQYIPVINRLINQYLETMNFFVEFELDQTFSETIRSRFRDTFSIQNFSEGEKIRINLAILFTWRQIARMRNSVNTNLLIFDEILDGSADGNAMDAFFQIIRDLEDGTNVFVISHSQDVNDNRFDRVLQFKKTNNFSRLV